MLKKVLFGAAVVAAAGFGIFSASQSNNQAQLSDLEVENVEALTNIEYIIEVGPLCTQMPSMMCHWEDGFEYPGQFL